MELRQKIQIIQNLIKVENFSLATINCKKLLKKYPNNSFVYNLCGLALQGDRKILSSVEFFTQALLHEPENIAAMNNLANSYKHLNQIEKAEDLYLKIIKKDPKNIKALNNYGNLMQKLNNFNEAIKIYEKAFLINKNQLNILFSLAISYQSIGEFEKAKDYALKILEIDSKNISAHKLISGITNYKEDKTHLKLMESLTEDQNLNNEQKIDLYFALGKAYEDLKDFKNSFNYLKEANKLKKEKTQYSISRDEKIFNNIIKTFGEIDINSYKKTPTNKQIIFICGMPRSGTTLLEQIIASHNQVSGAGELVYLQNVIKNNFFQELNLNKQKIIEEALTKKNTLAEKYLHLLNLHNYKTEIITDKTPPNFMWIGFIKIFFPNSKIIHCSRDARDNCLSLFKNNFASRDMEWAHDQNDIAQYYNLYLKLISFWKLKSPDSIYEANYESIVSNPEKETRKLLKFCNLEWDDNCLNFYKNKKTPIQTVSVSQARKPIYNSSVNSNSDYSKYLQDMYNILDTQ